MIKKINKITNFGIFNNFQWPPDNSISDFKEKNIIYGWNGTGKSTLATLFKLFEKKSLENKYTKNPSFEFETDENVKITQNNIEISPTVRVFDEEFISLNIDWTCEDKTEPIYFVGEENIKLSKELNENQNHLNSNIKKISDKTIKKGRIISQFNTWKQKLANRTIKDALRTRSIDKYTNYDRSSLENEINKNINIDNEKPLTDKEKTTLNKKIQQNILPHIQSIEIPPEIIKYVNSINSILQKTAISSTLDRLADNPEAENWVIEGLHQHLEKDYKECKFCGRILTKEILSDLTNHFNKEYEILNNKIKSSAERIESSPFDIELKKNEFDYEIRNKFDTIINDINPYSEAYNNVLNELLEKIKSKTPSLLVTKYSIIKNENFKNAKKLNSYIDKLNLLIGEHNIRVDNFDKDIQNAKRKLELSIISENLKEYRKYESDIQILDQEIQKIKEENSELSSRVSEIEGKLSDAGKAIEQINTYLADYFGREDIKFEYDDIKKGFFIKRNKKDGTNLSEGERTGIAFIYFLTKLEEKNFNKNNCIVVIDDPVSSLDSNSLYFAFGFLREKLSNTHQLFILTHTFDFMRQVKNWFYQIKRYEKGKNKIAFFMTDCYVTDNKRKANIKSLDKLLINFQSEYHYLLKLIIQLSENADQNLEEVYHYPNITRKFLEIFLSFKYPDENGLKAKMKKLVDQKVISEHTRIGISRFVNELSHDFNEDSTETFNASHLFTANDVAKKVIEIIKKLELSQYEMLTK